MMMQGGPSLPCRKPLHLLILSSILFPFLAPCQSPSVSIQPPVSISDPCPRKQVWVELPDIWTLLGGHEPFPKRLYRHNIEDRVYINQVSRSLKLLMSWMFLSQTKMWIKGGKKGRRERWGEGGAGVNEEKETLQFLEQRQIDPNIATTSFIYFFFK